MTIVVPNLGTREFLELMLSGTLTLKLYSNNRVPAITDLVADYTEVSGGGYSNKSLTFANWIFTTANPSVAEYNAFQNFNFTGATGAPSTIYGYFVIDSSNQLLWAERFPAGEIPFTPQNGSYIQVKPRITAASV